MPPTSENEKKLLLRGHEIVVHTAPTPEGGYYAFAVMFDPFRSQEEMKSFEARAASEAQAELECARQALVFLEQAPNAPGAPQAFKASRTTLEIEGRRVDIFCDLVGHEKYQAFPFLYRPDGKRVVIIRFHLDEAIVGASAEEAHHKCVRRLEQYFRDEAERAAGRPPSTLPGRADP